jgi:hypothetical protein
MYEECEGNDMLLRFGIMLEIVNRRMRTNAEQESGFLFYWNLISYKHSSINTWEWHDLLPKATYFRENIHVFLMYTSLAVFITSRNLFS